MSDKVGQQIGKYRLVRLLGRGGFAEVYLGQHVHLAAKLAAIKILHLPDVDVEAFKKEAETTVQLEHPHIVRLLDFDIEQGTPFLVLEFAPGGSLRTRHPKGSIVPLDSVIGYLKEIAPALQHAHTQRILHRDIKPDNMLIGRQNELLLSDFGIAVLSQSTRNSHLSPSGVGGTPYYMAPEMYRGKPEKASDQYSLGIVVYEWLAGTTPFTEGTFIQLGYQHCHEQPPPLREKNPAISPHVAAVIMTALSKDPRQRFGSVSAFANAFEQACYPSNQARSRVESTPNQSTPPWNLTSQGTALPEAPPASEKDSSIPPPPPPQSTNTYTQPPNPYAQPYSPPSTYPPPANNPYANMQQMPPLQRPYTQSSIDPAKQKRNKRMLLLGAIGGGVAGDEVAFRIVLRLGVKGFSEIPELIFIVLGAFARALFGATVGVIVGVISLAVIRKLAGRQALAYSGGKEVAIVTIAGIVPGAAIMVAGALGYYSGYLGTLVVLAVAVVVGVVAGVLVAVSVRKKS